ncbi:MAG TPA: beta-ketoacyl-ACP synthase III [Desulfohalobiaceae bacterium]|nr:beta-ketoacyl-ACP synthase III [Desulfohalobiaceae bacterium]
MDESRVNILGLGFYVPRPVLRNSDLEKMVETSDEWIISRTGIQERRIVEPGQACSDLALEATQMALSQAFLTPKDITHILFATFTPDFNNPTTACVLQNKLGMVNCSMAMDIGAGCSGFIYGLDTIRGLTAIYPDANILLVGGEVCTSRLNFQDRNTCVLFGDGAGAAIISGKDFGQHKPRVIDSMVRTDGSLGHLLPVGQEGGSALPYEFGQRVTEDFYIQMNGRELFRHAVRGMASMSQNILEKNELSIHDIDLYIPHQANLRIIEALAKKMDYPMEKVYVNVDRFGNTSAASVIIALSEAYSHGYIAPGYKVLLVSFGAGLTWGVALLQF